jgi:hypothetical protein
MNLRTDAYHSQDAIGEIQHSIDLQAKHKEELTYVAMYLDKKILNLAIKIKSKRSSLVAFVTKYDIDETSFPVLEKVLADDVFQDTVAEPNMGTVEVEQAMRKNIPDEFFSLLKSKILIDIEYEINDRIDELKKMKLAKAQLERQLLDIKKTLKG